MLRWDILNVNFRYGNFARAVFDFAKTMLGWGIVGGVFGLGAGVIVAAGWQRLHLRWRRRKALSLEAHSPTVAPIPATSASASPASSATTGADSAAAPSLIRYDDAGFSVDAFLTLSRRVWPGSHDLARAARAIERTANIGAWDGDRLVGAVRVLTDGYFYATVPEVLVDPTYRKRGIGRELMRRALAQSPGTLIIGATNDSVGFFQRLGCDVAPLGFVMRRPASPPADRLA